MKEQALLGLATTQELLNELAARISMAHEEGLNYRTAEPREIPAILFTPSQVVNCSCGQAAVLIEATGMHHRWNGHPCHTKDYTKPKTV